MAEKKQTKEAEFEAKVSEYLSTILQKEDSLKNCSVERQKYLLYSVFIKQYDNNNKPIFEWSKNKGKYKIDILIFEKIEIEGEGGWIPRVAIECKRGSLTTHDAIVYSAKASDHKQLHPYFRYGLLAIDLKNRVPRRLARHGDFFDFMVVFADEKEFESKKQCLKDLIKSEIATSRAIQKFCQNDAERWFSAHRELKISQPQQ